MSLSVAAAKQRRTSKKLSLAHIIRVVSFSLLHGPYVLVQARCLLDSLAFRRASHYFISIAYS